MTYEIEDITNPISSAVFVGESVPVEQYLGQPNGAKRGDANYVMSGSELMEFDNCARRWKAGYKEDSTSATDYGSLLDCLLMDGPKAVFERFLVLPETYSSKDGEKPWTFAATACKEWRKEHNPDGKRTEVKAVTWGIAQTAAERLLSDPQLKEMFASSRKQVMLSGVYVDSETGVRVPVKSLLDLVPPYSPPEVGYLVDLKTTNNAHPRAWKKHVFQFHYHVQAARHLDLWNAATGEQRNDFRHILQESIHPFEVAKRFLSSEFIALGRQRYVQALKRYAKALSTGIWEGYDVQESNSDMIIDGFLMVSPEPWMVTT